MYLKAAKLAEAMQLAAAPNQPSVRSVSPEAVSHGELPPSSDFASALHPPMANPCVTPLHHPMV